jgi:hypothetical protein
MPDHARQVGQQIAGASCDQNAVCQFADERSNLTRLLDPVSDLNMSSKSPAIQTRSKLHGFGKNSLKAVEKSSVVQTIVDNQRRDDYRTG